MLMLTLAAFLALQPVVTCAEASAEASNSVNSVWPGINTAAHLPASAARSEMPQNSSTPSGVSVHRHHRAKIRLDLDALNFIRRYPRQNFSDAELQLVASLMAEVTSSPRHELMEDLRAVTVQFRNHAPLFRFPLNDSSERANLSLYSYFSDEFLSDRFPKPRSSEVSSVFGYVAAVDGSAHALKASVGLCSLQRSKTKYPLLMIVANVHPAVLRFVESMGMRVIQVQNWTVPLPWVLRPNHPLGTSIARYRMLKVNVFGLSEYLKYGLFLDSDVYFRDNIDDVVDKLIDEDVEFKAHYHERPWCITSNVFFFRPSLRRFRRLMMRTFLANGSKRCSADDQMVLSAEFLPADSETYPSDPESKLKFGTREIHWQFERNGLLNNYERQLSKLDNWSPRCRAFFEHVLPSPLLTPNGFGCSDRTHDCYDRIFADVRI